MVSTKNRIYTDDQMFVEVLRLSQGERPELLQEKYCSLFSVQAASIRHLKLPPYNKNSICEAFL